MPLRVRHPVRGSREITRRRRLRFRKREHAQYDGRRGERSPRGQHQSQGGRPDDGTAPRGRTAAVCEREYNHRQQVIVGGVIMLCVALVMVMMNNYNPTR